MEEDFNEAFGKLIRKRNYHDEDDEEGSMCFGNGVLW